MTGGTRDAARALLAAALDLFLSRPELGFVWLARQDDRALGDPVVGACVCCYAISTSRGTLVAKLDDVTVAAGRQGQGTGAAMLHALALHLRENGVTRIDCACHRDNQRAWRFYERLGFRPLDEERIALVLDALPR
jgi:ribosomal protein S18 acetylase RimI-like enzyme